MAYILSYITNTLNEISNTVSSEYTDKFHKTAFSTFKIKVPKQYVTFNFADRPVQVLQYLPETEKIDIIEGAYQVAAMGNNFDPLLFNTFFFLNLVYSYTNLVFTDEQKKDELKIYDQLKSSGLLDEILKALPIEEKLYFQNNISSYVSMKLEEDYSFAGVGAKIATAITTLANIISEKFSGMDDASVQAIMQSIGEIANKK